MSTLDATRAELGLLVLYLNKAEARDKICRAIQYGSKFVSNGEPGPAQNVDKSTSLARKVFRILKFVNDLHALISPPPKDTPLPLILLGKSKNALLSTFLFLDQIVWAGRTGIYKNKERTERLGRIALFCFMGSSACSSIVELAELGRLSASMKKLEKGLKHGDKYQDEQYCIKLKKSNERLQFRGPSAETLKTTWLQKLKSEVKMQINHIEQDWQTTGCTIIADTWTDNKSRAFICFFVSSPLGTFFHKSVDASTYFKNTKCLCDLFDSVIQELGPEKVVQVIFDNTLNLVSVGNHIMQNYSSIFWSPCASHCVNLILEDFCKIDWVNRCIIQAQSITRFIYNHTWLHELMRNYTGGQELVCSGITESVSNFLSLQSMLRHRSRLKHMFNSPEYSSSAYASRPHSLSCTDILDGNDFWRAAEEIAAVSEPLLKVLRDVSGGKPAVGSIYESMTKVKDSIRTYYIMDELKCKTFLDIIDRRWQNQLHSRLHAAAAYLNPSIQYNPEVKFIGIIKEDLLTVLEKMLPTPELRHNITSELFTFRKAQGMFGSILAKEARTTTFPGMWWEQYGDSAPGLQHVAVRILSQVCSASIYEKNWRTIEQIHSEKRNRLDKETLSDLLFVHYNLKLHAKGKPAEIDPITLDEIDMTSDWVEETESPSPAQWLDRLSSALDGGDLNTRQFSNALFGTNDNIFG